VLDRLGISAGAGGGRRRASADDEPAAHQSSEESPAATEVPPVSVPDKEIEVIPELVAEREPEPVAAEPEPEPEPDPEPEPEPTVVEEPTEKPERERLPAVALHDEWLPRLKLPPSLAPFGDLNFDDAPSPAAATASAATSETHFTSTPVIEDDDLGEPFVREYSGAPIGEELPEDAGLADLLARALAEHQAGTSSAAALVKRLGSRSSSEPRTVNGHGNNGDAPSNGRHRGAS